MDPRYPSYNEDNFNLNEFERQFKTLLKNEMRTIFDNANIKWILLDKVLPKTQQKNINV